MSDTVDVKERVKFRVALQKVGTSLSNMVMPNIPALIAWGILTAFMIEVGWTPNAALASFVGPMIHYLLPLLIANTGGRMVYDARGAVVGVVATMGVIGGSDYLISQENARLLQEWVAAGHPAETFSALGEVHMFIGAMIMAPLAAWLMKKLDALWDGKIRAGFEMLVNLFSAGIFSFAMAVAGFYLLAPVVNGLMNALSAGVAGLINAGLLPLVSLLIEPAKVFFLNNAINHGVLTPLGIADAAEHGKSVLFMLEANPGPGLGILLAYWFFGKGAARASAPGAAIIHFFGGIHEIYFPYVLMRPQLIIAAIGGGMTGVFLNVAFKTGLVSPAAPGSFIAVMAVAARDSYVGLVIAVFGAAAVSFAIAALLLRISGKGEDDLAAATAKMEAMKGKKSSVAGALVGDAGADTSGHTGRINRIVFACDAGMGSSAMGATVLRNKVKEAGFSDILVTNKSIANLNDEWDVVVTQQELTQRARQRTGGAIHVSVDQFMNSPRYDEVVELVRERNSDVPVAAAAPAAVPARAAHAEPEPEPEPAREVMTDRTIILSGSAGSATDAIDEAGRLLVAVGAVDDDYVAAMHDREATVSTFMGNGLAIPHGTNEAKSAIKRTSMSFVRYAEPIDWKGEPVEFVIAIAGIGDEHLGLLQKVALTFADLTQVEKLRAASTADEVLDIFGRD